MYELRLTKLIYLLAVLAMAGCTKEKHLQDSDFEIPLTNYSLAQFVELGHFQATVFDKHVGSYWSKSSGQTNYFFSIIIERTNGEKLAVSEHQTPLSIFRASQALEKHHEYMFPDILLNSTRQP